VKVLRATSGPERIVKAGAPEEDPSPGHLSEGVI